MIPATVLNPPSGESVAKSVQPRWRVQITSKVMRAIMFDPKRAGVMSSRKLAASDPIRPAIYEERVTTAKLYRAPPVCD